MSHDIPIEHWQPGMRAVYVPRHAQGNLQHPDVESGIVTSVNDTYVFVRFEGDTTPKACDSCDLFLKGVVMHSQNRRVVASIAIAGLGICTAWMKPEYATTIMVIGSLFILLTIGC